MNAYVTKKESVRLYQGVRKEQVHERHAGKRRADGTGKSSGSANNAYGLVIREFMGTPADVRGMKFFPAENLL